MYSKRIVSNLLVACLASLILGSTALAATVTTDTTDYPRGGTVYITGSGFLANEIVTLQVVHADGTPTSGEGHDPWDVRATSSGTISSTWTVPWDDNLGEALLLTAVGQTSLLEAYTVFTDNVGSNLDQLQNGTLTQSPEWANGNINAQNSCYSEGDGVPFRYFLTGVATGEKYRFTIQSEATKAFVHAYDYFVNFDITETDALDSVGGVCGTDATTPPGDCNPTLGYFPFPDPTVAGNYTTAMPPSDFASLPANVFPLGFVPDSPANLAFYGATVDSIGPYFYTGTAADLELNVYVYVTITHNGSAGFFWAGHLAEGVGAWGAGLGSGSVSGAPYHMRALDVKTIINGVPQGSGAKNQDRSIQNGTICLPPDATISCAVQNIPCSDPSSSCSAATGADDYEWVVTGATIDSGQGTNTIYYTATGDTVRIYLTACSTTGACPGDFCCAVDSAMVTVDLDTTPPVIVQCPADITLGCNPPSIPPCDPGAVLASDPCGTPSITCTQIGSDVVNGCLRTRTYRYYVSDPSGNVDSCDQHITWTVDTQKPVFTVCPPDQSFGCNPASIPPALLGDATATDNCGTPSKTVVQGTPINVGCNWTRRDVWTATDACGNKDSCVRILTWTVDTQKPVFTLCPPSQNLGCNPTVPPALAGNATATDNCGTPSVTVVQGTPTANGCVYTRVDTWTATDACGNTETCSRTLTWTQDTQKPVFTVCPSNQDLGCNPSVIPPALLGNATATDNCGTPSVTVVQGTPTNSGCNWTRTDTWTATDACGNTETCSRTLTWTVDTQKPVFTLCPPSQSLGCNPTVPPALVGDATATDNCGAPSITVVQGTPTANGCAYTRVDTWTATDACGNSETCTRTLTWTQDTQKPVFTVCPSNQDLGCNPSVIPPALLGDATATDDCGTPSVTVVQGTPTSVGCGWARRDVWTATDACGNKDSCVRTLTWTIDTQQPVFSVCPSDQNLGCNPSTVPPARLDEVVANNGCGSVSITLVQGTEQQNGCSWSRTDVWTATDICGNTATCTRIYTWTVDTQKPVFTLCPSNRDLGCNPTVPPALVGDATATDNCGTPSVTVVQGTPTVNGCVYTRVDTWTATDACGNSEICTRTLTWTQDTQKPVFTICPSSRDLGCNPTVPPANLGDATATDNCGTPSVTVVQGTPSANACAYTRRDVWTATDACGNKDSCVRVLTWTQDTQPPTFTVCPANRDLGCDPASIPPATLGEATATDNCGASTVTLVQGTPQFDGCVYTRTDVWTATDACSNSATCSRTLTWKVDTAPVASCPGDTMVFLCEVQDSLCLGPFSYTDPDCNEQITQTVSLGTLRNGFVCFTPENVGVYVIEYVVRDGCGKADTCRTTVYVSQPQIVIDTISTLQNTTVDVCVRVNGMSFPWGGFDFLLTYDPIILSLLEVVPGDFIVDCGWEYFTFRLIPGSPTLVRVVAIADMNNSNKHPSCRTPDSGAVIFCLRFKVTNDRTLACQATPIRFWWTDCGDNSISDTTGNILYIAGDLPGTVVDAAGNDYTGFPNIGGPEHPCPSDKFVSLPCIEYRIGKVRLICPGEIDDRGDMNLNGLAYEISDAVLYSQYFIFGSGVLTMGNPPGEAQIAASDVNADGNPLTVADLVYLIRVVTGDVEPIPDDYIGGSKLTPSVGTLNVGSLADARGVTVSTGSDQDLGAALFVFDYDQTAITDVTLLDRAAGMDVAYRADGGRLNVLVYNITDRAKIAAGTGDIFRVHTTGGGSVSLSSVEAASFAGGALDVQFAGKAITPDRFALHQNYPNPFNPSTSFAVDFPKASDYTLTIYNITGQIVREIRGHASAGTTTISWQGNDNAGQPVASGVYFYRLNAGEFSAIRKMVLMK